MRDPSTKPPRDAVGAKEPQSLCANFTSGERKMPSGFTTAWLSDFCLLGQSFAFTLMEKISGMKASIFNGAGPQKGGQRTKFRAVVWCNIGLGLLTSLENKTKANSVGS